MEGLGREEERRREGGREGRKDDELDSSFRSFVRSFTSRRAEGVEKRSSPALVDWDLCRYSAL